VQLVDQIGALGDELRRALHVEALRAQPGVELAEDVVAFFDRVLAENVALSLGLVRLARHCLFHPGRSRGADPDFPVMEHRRIAGTHLRCGDPHVLFEVGLHEDVLVVDRAARRQFERLRHLDDDVRLDVPAVLEREGGRRIRLVTGGRSGVRPRGDRLDLTGGQAAVVLEMPIGRIGKPWRHFLAGNGSLDGLRPRP
jgi:hypothetical protein